MTSMSVWSRVRVGRPHAQTLLAHTSATAQLDLICLAIRPLVWTWTSARMALELLPAA